VLVTDLIQGPQVRELLCREFPGLRSEFEDDTGLLHLQMETLRRHVEGWARSDIPAATRALALVESLATNPKLHPIVENAIYVSFLEGMKLPSKVPMPPALARMHREHEQYMDEMARSSPPASPNNRGTSAPWWLRLVRALRQMLHRRASRWSSSF
jgi:hypothetical protein